MNRVLVSVFLVLFAFPLLAGGPRKGDIKKVRKAIPGNYIVVLEDRVEDVEAVADDLARKHRGTKKHVYKSALKGFSAELSEKEALALSVDPRVKYVEEDGEVSIDATQSGATWGLDRTDQRDLPLSTTYTYDFTGSGVKALLGKMA